MECQHSYQEFEYGTCCVICGLQDDDFPPEDVYLETFLQNYISDIALEKQTEIIDEFTKLHEIYPVRGNSKRALFAACVFHINTEAVIVKDILLKFNISKSQFSNGVRMFLTQNENKKYRVVQWLPSDYVSLVQTKTEFPLGYVSEIRKQCEQLDNDKWLSNFNPFTVCMCVSFRYIKSKDASTMKKMFFNEMGISDQTVRKILRYMNLRTRYIKNV